MMLYPAVLTAMLFGTPAREQAGPLRSHARAHRAVGLGTTLTTPYGSEIFGFDVDQNGTDGIFDETLDGKSSINEFDQTTGQILKVLKRESNDGGAKELVTFGIVGQDVGVIDSVREISQNPFVREDAFYTVNPVSGGGPATRWKVGNTRDLVLDLVAENQTTDTQVALLIDLDGSEGQPVLWVWNSSTGKILHRYAFGGLSMAEDTVRNRAVIPASTAGGSPTITLVNLDTGKSFTFNGLNNGPAGSTNAIAVDSTTDIACTVTEENAQAEFYTLKNGVGRAAQLPRTGNQSELNSGQAVAVDQINHLFLVAQPISSVTPSGSTIYVYNETGELQETLNGFDFTNIDRPIQFPTHIVINPSQRLGWVQGSGTNTLQQFFY